MKQLVVLAIFGFLGCVEPAQDTVKPADLPPAAEEETPPLAWCERFRLMSADERKAELASSHAEDRKTLGALGFGQTDKNKHCWDDLEKSADEASEKYCTVDPADITGFLDRLMDISEITDTCFAGAK